LLDGSIRGEVWTVFEGRVSHWSSSGFTQGPTIDDSWNAESWKAGGWLVEWTDEQARLWSPHFTQTLEFSWPAVAGLSYPQKGIVISPDGTHAALFVAPPGLPGRVVVHELPSGRGIWSRELDPRTTALTMTNDALWIADGLTSESSISALELATGHQLRRWAAGRLPSAIIGLAVVPSSDTVIGVFRDARALQLWSTGGQRKGELPLAGRGFVTFESSTWNLGRRSLQPSSYGSLLIVDMQNDQDQLLRLADGESLGLPHQLVFAEEPDAVLWSENRSIGVWDFGAGRRGWQLDRYEGDEWVWSDSNQLLGYSPGAAEALAPMLQLSGP
jgi:hypothetical protein